jgi:PAS domain S-box-containing protein
MPNRGEWKTKKTFQLRPNGAPGPYGLECVAQELKASEDRLRAIESEYEGIVVIQDGSVKYMNEVVWQLSGYVPEEIAGHAFIDFVHPQDRQMMAERYRKRLQGESVPSRYESRVVWKNGLERWLDICVLNITWENRPATLNFLKDITERKAAEQVLKKARDEMAAMVERRTTELLAANEVLEAEVAERKRFEETLRRREAILEAIGLASERFLRAGPGEVDIEEVLQRLGEATGVSRVYVFENYPDERGAWYTGQRHEWTAENIDSQMDNPVCQDFPWQGGGMERWAELMSRDEIVQGDVNAFPRSEREILAPQGISSIVAVPIFVDGTWWGFIGFDECLRERDWSRAEVDALKTSAEILGAAIEHHKAQQALHEHAALLTGILSSLHETALVIYDEEGRCKFAWGPSDLEARYGFKMEELVGKHLEEILPSEEAQARVAQIRHVFRTKESIRKEYLFCCPGGEFWHDISLSPVLNDAEDVQAVAGFVRDVTDRKMAEDALWKAHEELEQKVEERTRELQELNTALRVLLKNREQEKRELEEKVLLNVRTLVSPFVERLQNHLSDKGQRTLLDIIETNLNEIVSPLSINLSSRMPNLTPSEIQVASLIKEGRTSKEIAGILHISKSGVDFHRNNLRKKLQLNKKKVNLRSHLLSMS